MVKWFLIFLLFASPCWGGVDFDGTDDYIEVTDIDVDNMTACALVNVENFPTTGNYGQIIGKGYDGTSEGFMLRLVNASGTLNLQSGCYSSAVGWGEVTWAIADWNADEWHHVCCRHDGSTWKVYFDGVEKASVDDADGAIANARSVYIGVMDANGVMQRYFDGQITEVALWDTSVDVSNILLMATAKVKRLPLQIDSANLVGYWPMDDEADGTSADGDTFIDLSGNGNDGTGDDGGNNTGLTAKAEEVLSYP